MNAVIKKSFPLSKENGKDIKSIFIIFPRQGSSAFTKPAVLGLLDYGITNEKICQGFFTFFTEISPEERISVLPLLSSTESDPSGRSFSAVPIKLLPFFIYVTSFPSV